MMKALLISTCLSLVTFPLLARADEASKLTKIEEMLVLTHADQVVQQVTAQMQPMMAQQMKQLNLPEDARPAVEEMQKKMMDWVSTKLSWEKMKPVYIKLYDETLTEEEVNGAVAFYKTPAGQALLNKMPLLMQKTMVVMQDMLGEMIPEFAKMGEELAKKYKQK